MTKTESIVVSCECGRTRVTFPDALRPDQTLLGNTSLADYLTRMVPLCECEIDTPEEASA